MDMIIRQASRDDKDAIWEFVDHIYKQQAHGKDHYRTEDQWKWQYLENPSIREMPKDLPIWLALQEGKIVGQTCAIPANMKIGDQTYYGGWGCDFIVAPQLRGTGIGQQLTKMYFEHFDLCVVLSMATSSRRVVHKFGPIALRPIKRLIYPIRLNAVILHRLLQDKLNGHPKTYRLYETTRRFFKTPSILAFLANRLALARTIANPLRYRRLKVHLQEISGFDSEIDNFSDKTCQGYGAIVKREASFLNWKFFQNKQFRYNAFIARADGLMKGYLVLRKPHFAEGNIGHIVDFYTARNDSETLKDLISFAIRYFGRSVSAIHCATSMAEIQRILHRFGFMTIETLRPLATVSDPIIKERIHRATDEWYLTLADQDLERVRVL